MLRRLNYTNRRKIVREKIKIALRQDGGVPCFDAMIQLDDLHLPESAKVYVEAYYQSAWMRFDFGTVGSLVPAADRRLTVLAGNSIVRFRVKVVDESEEIGKIIAIADRLTPIGADEDSNERDSLLPVNIRDGMGQEIWRLDWDDDSGPVLELNKNIPEIKTLITRDPRFQPLVLPAILRFVLFRILADQKESDDQGEGGWAVRWIAFAKRFAVSALPADEDQDPTTIENWINDVVVRFCETHHLSDIYRRALYGEEEII